MGAGLHPVFIRRALTTFASDDEQALGRLHHRTIGEVDVPLDYGHNAAALAALGEAIASFAPVTPQW
ncbi:MAG: hypothetical protein H0X24_03485 [Ktedonobacterales bacterium]|nr:hypothetical protein [Ktedonobacterales bacterium]